ncbi:MAG: DUF1778 domain-containing protein [Hyphomicrobiales bacterium]
MLNEQDTTSTINEPKSQRKDLRFKPSVIDVIERASQAVGMDSSTFITSAAYRAAQEIEAAQHKTVIPADAFDAFAHAVDRPAKDNPALSALFEKRKALLEDD